MTDAAQDSKPPGQYYCPTCEKNFAGGETCPDDGTRLVRLRVNDPLIGRVLDGRYTIQEKLGQGGMGAVYRGSQHSVGREVAIKLVTPQLVSDADVIKRFLREAKLASRLSHPNAVAVLDFGQTDDGLFYLVMELVTGRTLDQVMKAEKKLKPERVVRIGMQVCDALEGAHALQIVHRDLKPANIMLLSQGRDLVKVLDFGLAKSLAPDQTSTTMTNAGALLGTPAFMPPELALGQPCDGRADLYSLGCILFLLGSGRLPFVSDSAHELIAMHGMQAAPPMEGVPPQLAGVIDRMLEKDPARRFQSAAETREALEAAIDAHRIMTPVPGISIPNLAASSSAHASPSQHKRVRSSTELERLANSETMVPQAAAAVTSAVSASSTRRPAAPKKSRGALMVALALVVVGGIAAFVLVKNGQQSSPSPEATQRRATQPDVEQPAVQQPDVKQPDVKQPDVEQPDVTKAVPDVANAVPDVTKAEITIKKDDTPKPDKTAKTSKTSKSSKTSTVDRSTRTAKTAKTDKTTKTGATDATKTTPPETPKTTGGTATGSAAKLPF